jgi:hypothetical protein
MRWLFAALILAHVGLLMWGLWYREDADTARREPYPAVHPEKMRLLSEAGVRLKPRAPKPPDKNEAPPAVSPGCYRLGPFAKAEEIAKLEAALGEMALASARREEAVKTVTGYRVYLPPFPSKEAAEKKRRELTQLGFKDHALLQEEGLENALSLGVFSVEANARNHLRRLAAQGVPAKLLTLEQARTVYWLDVKSAELTEAARAGLKQLAGDAGAELHESACPAAPVSPPETPPSPETPAP